MPSKIKVLTSAELNALVVTCYRFDFEPRRRRVTGEIASLKQLKERPDIKPNEPARGMDNASRPVVDLPKPEHRGGGPKTQRWVIHDDCIVKTAAPARSRFKGDADFVVQDLVLRVDTVRYRRERYLTAEDETAMAALPPKVRWGSSALRCATLCCRSIIKTR